MSGIFASIGMRLIWRDGELRSAVPSASSVSIEVRFTGEAAGQTSLDALAYAFPFGERAATVYVIYDRIRWIAGRSAREAPILAYVLAHEIGHILQRTNGHAQTGIMKAHWSAQDYDAMERKQLRFTSTDVDLIRQGLDSWKGQTADRSSERPL